MSAAVFGADVWDQAAESIRLSLVALDLPGIQPSQIQIREPVDGDDVAVGISIHWVAEELRDYSNIRDKVGYGIAITDIVDKATGRLEGLANQSRRRAVMRRNRTHKRLANVSFPGANQLHTSIEPNRVQLPRQRNNYRAHSFIIRFWMIEPRT